MLGRSLKNTFESTVSWDVVLMLPTFLNSCSLSVTSSISLCILSVAFLNCSSLCSLCSACIYIKKFVIFSYSVVCNYRVLRALEYIHIWREMLIFYSISLWYIVLEEKISNQRLAIKWIGSLQFYLVTWFAKFWFRVLLEARYCTIGHKLSKNVTSHLLRQYQY